MSNTIEEFVIKFITDAKEAKKGASDLDKFLDQVTNKQIKRDDKLVKSEKSKRKAWENSQKSKAKTQKSMEALRAKQEENLKKDFERRVALYKKEKKEKNKLGDYSNLSRAQREQAAIEKAISARQDKELKRELALAKVHKNTAAVKKASEASQRKEIAKTRKHILDSYGKEAKEIKDMRSYYKSLEKSSVAKEDTTPIGQFTSSPQKKKKAWEDSQKRRAKLNRQREDDRRKEEDAIRSVLMEKVAAKKAENEAIKKVNKSLEKQAAIIRRSAGYKLYRKHGQEGGINSQIADLVSKRDLEGLTSLRYKMSDARENMAKYSREVRKATVIQKGFSDSTRNMVRSFASVYAVVEGTRAIKNTGQSFQGMEASMLAASGTATAAAHDMSFINSIVNEMGLNLKDTTDAFVKFKFAAKGKISQGEQEDLFKSLSMFGTALKVDSEAMKRSQKALIQMMSKGKIMAEELKNQLNHTLSCLMWKHVSEKLL